jgi:hypothetical protein
VGTDVGIPETRGLPRRVRHHWHEQLRPERRAQVVSWASFATTWVCVRGLTHWIRRGHGPRGGGLIVGGEHFHHYNLGILGLETIGAAAIFGIEPQRHRLVTAAGYGTSTALIVDEAALLLDLEDVYWAKQGRTSVDLAVGIIALGGLAVTGGSFWSAVGRELKRAVGVLR